MSTVFSTVVFTFLYFVIVLTTLFIIIFATYYQIICLLFRIFIYTKLFFLIISKLKNLFNYLANSKLYKSFYL